MKQLKHFIFILLLGISPSLFAATVTFDPPPCNTCQFGMSNYDENGVYFSGSFAHYGMSTGYPYNNSTGAINLLYGDYIRIELLNGGLFSLLSVDLAEYSTVFSGQSRTITFSGKTINNVIVTQTFTTDGIVDGIGGQDDFESFIFSSQFDNLTYVDINTDLFSMDNLVVQAVPLPAASWLFLSGIILLISSKKCLTSSSSGR